MSNNGFSAADMSTAAANGHAEGYQAGYADAVKAVEAGKDAAAPGIDLEQFREAVENLEWQNRGHANPDFPTGDPEKHAECLRLLALIDASSKGDIDPLCAAKRPGCDYPACGCTDASPKGGSEPVATLTIGEVGGEGATQAYFLDRIRDTEAFGKLPPGTYQLAVCSMQATSAEVGA